MVRNTDSSATSREVRKVPIRKSRALPQSNISAADGAASTRFKREPDAIDRREAGFSKFRLNAGQAGRLSEIRFRRAEDVMDPARVFDPSETFAPVGCAGAGPALVGG